MASIRDLLQDQLDDLLEEAFQRFKSYLNNKPVGFESISRNKLEKAKQLDVVNLMVDQYGESDAAKITVEGLKQIKQNRLATDLEKKLEGKVSGGSQGPVTAQVPVTAQGPVTAPETKQRKGADFVDKHREALIQRVSSVMEIADCLLSKKMITDEIYSNLSAGSTSQGQMRILYKCLNSGAVKEEFYEILKKKHPHLVDDLEP